MKGSGLYLKENGMFLEYLDQLTSPHASLATEVPGTFRVNGSNKRMRDLQALFETPPRVRFMLFYLFLPSLVGSTLILSHFSTSSQKDSGSESPLSLHRYIHFSSRLYPPDSMANPSIGNKKTTPLTMSLVYFGDTLRKCRSVLFFLT